MRFYVLDHSMKELRDATTYFVALKHTKRKPGLRCPVCGTLIGMLRLQPPVEVELELYGHHFGDIAFGPSYELLVSRRFKDAFLTEGLSGFPCFMPAEITRIVSRRKLSEQTPQYYSVLRSESRAAIDDKASGRVLDEPWTCEECRSGGIRRIDRVVLESGTWSGEDVFAARGLPGRILASQRFKQFCERHAFKNCLLVPADQFRVDHYRGQDARPMPTRGR